jgi:hypothetical protein
MLYLVIIGDNDAIIALIGAFGLAIRMLYKACDSKTTNEEKENKR